MVSWRPLRRRTGRPTGRESPESLDPIRSFLIDSGCLKALRTVICAKLFHRADVLIVNSVNLNCSAHCTRNSSPMTRCVQPLSLYKSLFHRIFFNFPQTAQKFATTIESARQQFDFDHTIALHRVARCPSTRLLKRYRCFFARAVVNRIQRVSIPDAC